MLTDESDVTGATADDTALSGAAASVPPAPIPARRPRR